jgi:hypothetical protein
MGSRIDAENAYPPRAPDPPKTRDEHLRRIDEQQTEILK